jgi:hypothetical protein
MENVIKRNILIRRNNQTQGNRKEKWTCSTRTRTEFNKNNKVYAAKRLVPRGRIDSLIFKSIFRRGIFVENKVRTKKEQRKNRDGQRICSLIISRQILQILHLKKSRIGKIGNRKKHSIFL